MTVAVANTYVANTFSHWMTRTNELATAMSTQVVTVGGVQAVGSASVSDTFSANTINANNITASDGTISLNTANLTIASSSKLITAGDLNLQGSLNITSHGLVKFLTAPTANARYLCANSTTGNLEFSTSASELDAGTNVDTTNAAKSNNTILQWNTATSKWQSNTITLIAQTTVANLSVGVLTGDLTVTGNTNFSNGTLYTKTSGKVGVNTNSPTAALHVNGTILATGDIAAFQTSDRSFKKNIEPYSAAAGISLISQLEVKEFDWNTAKVKKSEYVNDGNTGHDVGLIAQEVKEILPAFVQTRPDGTLAVAYVKLIPYLISSIQALQQEIRDLRNGR